MRNAVLIVLTAIMATDAGAQRPDTRFVERELAEAMRLNRAGKWKEAAALSDRIAETAGISDDQKARALSHAAAASLRSGDTKAAELRLERLKPLVKKLPENHWVIGQSKNIEESLAARKAGRPGIPRRRAVVPEDGFWKPAEAAARAALFEVVPRFESLGRNGGGDAGLLVRDGAVVHEWTSKRYQHPMTAMSSTKSITAILVGMLQDDGKLSIDMPLGRFLPEWSERPRAQVTIRHLLSHTSGLANRASRGEMGVGGEGDKNAYVRRLKLDHAVGSRFSYSNEGVQLLSPMLDAAAGKPIQDYARTRLFLPLGMRNTRFKRDAKGHAWTYADIETTPRDLARIGLLMLDGGLWQGKRIVSRDWVQACTRPGQKLNPSCGYLWWLFDGGFAAQGYLGTDIHVFPKTRTVAVRMQRKPGPQGNPGSAYRKGILALFGEPPKKGVSR